MKTLKITLSATTAFLMLFLLIEQANAQLEFIGNYADGMGGAGWNADGSGPEPYGDGHGDIFYYTASRDYVDGADYCGAELTDVLNGFPAFEDSLIANGYSYEQVTLKLALADLGDDIIGIDYFSIAGLHYCNFYPVLLTIELDGEALVEGIGDYSMYISGTNVREFQSGFLKINNISGSSSVPVQNVAGAFLEDMDNEELHVLMQLSENVNSVTGNGRSGAYANVACTFEKGLPEIPFESQYDNEVHEGFAGWDADGTGPEPFGDGHDTQLYYGASLDYNDLDPDPNACLAHFLDGSIGFMNTLLQLEYRGYEIGDLKCIMGLNSLGPDVEGEDWGNDWSNYYNNSIIIEVDGEPILSVLQDTNKLFSMGAYWSSIASIGKVYDISGNASSQAQFVAQSFLKDLGSHILKTNAVEINYVSGAEISGNGRDGAIYTIAEGSIVGIHPEVTFIPEGTVSGTWTVEGSPYYVEGHLTIENGQTLEIEPGVRVGVRGPYHFAVDGCIKAEGSADQPIMFTASNPNITWDGIDYDNTAIGNDSSKFDHCLFRYAYAQGPAPSNSGGAFAINFSKISITNSIFEFNKADIPAPPWTPSGGAIAIFGCDPFIQKCIFRHNQATDAAAIIVYDNANPIISNCLFYNNQAESDAGVIEFNTSGNGIIINNTFADNQAAYGGAIQVKSNSDPMFINNIFWGNEATTSGNQIQIEDAASQPGFYYCDIEGGQAGFGGLNFNGEYLNNIDDDPVFGENEEFPFKVSNASPCVNVGVPSTSSFYYEEYQPDFCLCGFERDYGGCIDIGAYETDVIIKVNQNIQGQENMFVYPNPATSAITISLDVKENSDVTIGVFNYLGQQVDEFKIANQIGKEIILDISNFKTGTYFCKLTSGSKVYTGKFIKN